MESTNKKEHPWRCAESGNNGFIDIVLTDVHNTQRMVIECKRVRDTEWVFLDPSISVNDRRHTRFWMSYIENYKTKVFDWHDGVVDPSSPETEFCVVHGQDKNSKPMLERIASELVDATESFAKEEFKLYDKRESDFLGFYFSAIMTTAELKICKFKPEDISIENGELSKAEFTIVPFVRFRKCLTSTIHLNTPFKLIKEVAKAKERTVFVINATKMIDVLKDWDFKLPTSAYR